MKKTTYQIVICAFFAALTAVCSQLSLPLPFTPVPMNLGLMAVLLTGCMLGGADGGKSIAAYLLLGCAGVPVFSGFRGGIAVLAGPTGGYAVGYLPAAIVAGCLLKYSEKKNVPAHLAAMTAGLAVCYTMGTAWFILLTDSSLPAALGMCVLPFLAGDAVKIACAALLAVRVRKAAGTLLPRI